MYVPINPAWLLLTLMVGALVTNGPAAAHSFSVALILPASAMVAEQNKQIRQGFMLATAERDAHPDQESDGHLGGLDVYITALPADAPDGTGPVADPSVFDIVVAFDAGRYLTRLKNHLGENQTAVLYPATPPFLWSQTPAVVAFRAAYQKQFGTPPTAAAAQGYNAARRIDAAVRGQAGAADKNLLARSFEASGDHFTW